MTRLETAQMLREHDNFIILTHRRPDGDTTGCAAGLCLGLRALGKSAWVLRNRAADAEARAVCRRASDGYLPGGRDGHIGGHCVAGASQL